MPLIARLVAGILGPLAAGVAMSFGQSAAPEWLHPLVNSAAPVVAIAAAAALAVRHRAGAIALAAAAGPLVMIGYYVTSSLRGFAVSTFWPVFWCTAGVVTGAVVGAVVVLLRRPPRAYGSGAWWRGVAAGVWPAVAFGEAAHGLLRVSETTPAGYWWAEAAVGVAVLAWTAASRVRGAGPRSLAVATALAGAVAVFVAYGAT